MDLHDHELRIALHPSGRWALTISRPGKGDVVRLYSSEKQAEAAADAYARTLARSFANRSEHQVKKGNGAMAAKKKKTRKKVAKKAAKKTSTKKSSTKKASPAQLAVRARFAAAAKRGGIKKGVKLGKGGSAKPAKARKAATKKVAKRRRKAAPVYGPSIDEHRLDLAMARHKRRQKRQYDKEYPVDAVYGPAPRPRKKAKKKAKTVCRVSPKQTITLADIKRGVVKSAAAPKVGVRRQARKARVAYICAGPTRSGCGGGKKGSHVLAQLW